MPRRAPAATSPRARPTTTELPDLHPYRFGDTAEIPIHVIAPSPARRGPWGTIGLVMLMVVLIAVAAAVAFLPTSLLSGSLSGDEATSSTVTRVDESAETAPVDVASAEISVLADERPQSWNVTGVSAGLNVRAMPGVDAELLGALRADATMILGTGRRVAVGGREWKQIRFEETLGWVSAAYLTPASSDLGNPQGTVGAAGG